MENPESVNTDPSSENPNGLHKEDGELHQAVEAEGAAAENRAKAAVKEGKKEDSVKSDKDQASKELCSKKTLKELESHFVVQSDKLKDSNKCLDAPFYCELCELKLANLTKSQSHVKTKGHKRAVKTKGEFLSLSQVPPPSEHQALALSKLLDSVFLKHGLCPVKDLPIRQKVAEDVTKTVCAKFPECSVSIYGSSFTGFGLKESDINLDLAIPDEVNVPHVLLSILDLLQKDDHYCDVISEFDAKVPRILFKHISSGLICELSPGNITASKTSWLLKKYCDFDPRVRTLVVALRYWARICNIDCQSEGGLPGYSLALMVIQFLQETKPPVLPRWVPFEAIDKDSPDNSEAFVSNNKESTGSLWFQLFRFYCFDFDIPNLVISIEDPMPVSREKKKWGHRRIAIEDPFSSKRNVACSLSSDRVFDYFFTCWKNSFRYFSSSPNGPQNEPIADVQNLRPSPSHEKNDSKTAQNKKLEAKLLTEEEAIFQMDDLDSVTKQVESLDVSNSDCKDGSVSQRHTAKDSPSLENKDNISTETEVKETLSGSDCEDDSHPRATKTTIPTSKEKCHNALNNITDAAPQNFVYTFDAQVFRGNNEPIQTCCFCKMDGHVKEQCPDLRKPSLCRLPQMNPRFGAVLDYVCKKCRGVCIHCYKTDFEFEKSEVSYREKVLQNLEEYIHQIFPAARLFLFGSSKNGFGFRNSDIDICMTLENQVKEEVDFVDVIIELSKLLKKHKDCGNVLAITTAKVPIVKFYLRSCKREADISLYNTLALENTRMLATYAKLDDRVVTLGYAVKVFAKVCDIGDASKGSLSSYAYILMLLHYLQQCQPPVIPVLQTLHTDSKPPEKIIDGWNCWFLSDLKTIKTMWNQKEKNTLSAGLLWYGFLRYYTEEFDFEHDVVCCRRTKKLTKFEKMWTKHVFAIEDPFNLDHNLGAGVTRKMANYILTTFIRGRERFGIPRYDIPLELSQRFFFDVYYLTDGYEAPTDRNCRVCGKIGHIAKDCPHSKANRRAEQKKEEEERRVGKESSEKSGMSQKPFNARPRSASAPNKQEQNNKNVDSSKPPTTAQPEKIPPRQEANASSGTTLSRSQPDSQVVASPLKGTQGSKLGKDISENVRETVQSETPHMQLPVEDPQTGLTNEDMVSGNDETVPVARNAQSHSVNSSNGNKPSATEAVQTLTSNKSPQSQEQSSHPGSVKPPPGFCTPDGTAQIPHMPSQGSPQRMAGSVTHSSPMNVSPAGIFQGQPIVMGTPPQHHPGMFSPQGSPFVGSPVQRDMWLRQQGGIMRSPHSPPVRPLVPYPVSPVIRPVQPQQQWRGASESLLVDHLGSPIRGHQRLTEHNHHMLPQSPPNITRNVMWPLPPNSPQHNLASYQDPAIVREHQFSLPGHHPPFPQGNFPSVPPQQTHFPHATPPGPAVGSPQPMPQLPQPTIGAHMTGEQFINLMRAFEEESKKVEVLPTDLPSNNEFESKELHIAPKNLKVAETPEEHKLLSKLSKVKSLWEGNTTPELQSSCSNPETITGLDPIGHLQEQSDMGYSVSDTKLPEKREAWVTVAEKESGIDGTDVVQIDPDERNEQAEESKNNSAPLAEDRGAASSEAVSEEARPSSGSLEASDEKAEVPSSKRDQEHQQKSKGKRRPRGRGRKPKGPRLDETANSTAEKQEKPTAGNQSKAKNSPGRSHHPKSYDDVKGDAMKASPKKPGAERSDGSQGDPQSAHRGAEATPRQMRKNKESPANEKGSEKGGPEAKKQDHGKNTRTGNPANPPGDSSKGGAPNRGRRRPRSRTSKGGPGGEKQDTRNRSNSTPEKRQPKDS